MATFSGTASPAPRHPSRRRAAALLALLAATGSAAVVQALTRPADDAVLGTRQVVFVTTPTRAAVSLSNMAPGDEITGAVSVANGGVPLQYGIASTTTGALADVLQLTIRTGVERCGTGDFDRSGAAVYGPGPLGRQTSLLLVGAGGGRPLAPHARERLCFRVELPLATRSQYAGLSSDASFCFAPAETLRRRFAARQDGTPVHC